MRQPLRFVDLFAGIGGFHQALADPEIGGECVLAVEIDPACQQVYRANWPDTPLVGDVRTLTQRADGSEATLGEIADAVPDHDVLCAGFPCQPFSKSGFQQGVRDRTRGTLFFDIMEIIRAKRPRFVVLENVRNLAGPRHVATLATIVRALREASYRVADDPIVFSPHLLPPELGGAPQVRERVFIVAERVDVVRDPADLVGRVLIENRSVPGWDPTLWRVESILDSDDEIRDLERYRLRPEEVGWIEAWQAFVQEIPSDWLPGFPIWADQFVLSPSIPDDTPAWKADFLRKNASFYAAHRRVIDRWRRHRWGPLRQRLDEFPPSRRKFEWQARTWQPTRAERNLWDLVMHLRPSGIRVRPPTYLPALVAITQTSVIGSRRRRVTPTEAARLQSMDPRILARGEVDDATAYRQLGNAVNVGVARHVVRTLLDASARGWALDAVQPRLLSA
jgi:DNA (cytosine-5)-methyltransferase 1